MIIDIRNNVEHITALPADNGYDVFSQLSEAIIPLPTQRTYPPRTQARSDWGFINFRVKSTSCESLYDIF
jgi:hypothetical protein